MPVSYIVIVCLGSFGGLLLFRLLLAETFLVQHAADDGLFHQGWAHSICQYHQPILAPLDLGRDPEADHLGLLFLDLDLKIMGSSRCARRRKPRGAG